MLYIAVYHPLTLRQHIKKRDSGCSLLLPGKWFIMGPHSHHIDWRTCTCVCVCLFHLFPITLGFLIFLFCHCLFFFTSSLFPLLFFISPHFHYLWCYPTTSSVLSRSLSTIEPYIMSFTYLWTCQVEEYFYQVCPNWNGLALKFYTDINSPRGWMLISFTSWCWVKFVPHFWLRGSILHIYWVSFCFLVIL